MDGCAGSVAWTPTSTERSQRPSAASASGRRASSCIPAATASASRIPSWTRWLPLAAERRAPVLFHAGRGIPNLGLATARLAERHPDGRFVLAHAGISDLGLLGPVAAELPNLLFDTSWWNVSDVLALVTSIPPGQILYASDMPYGTGLFSAFLLSRAMREAGLTPEAWEAIAGGQLERVLCGEPLVDLGPAVGPAGLSARDPALERVTSHTTAVMQLAYAGGEPAEAVALARLGCQHAGQTPHAELLDAADRLLALGTEHRAAAGGDPFALLPCLLAAHALCGTPTAGVPDRQGVVP